MLCSYSSIWVWKKEKQTRDYEMLTHAHAGGERSNWKYVWKIQYWKCLWKFSLFSDHPLVVNPSSYKTFTLEFKRLKRGLNAKEANIFYFSDNKYHFSITVEFPRYSVWGCPGNATVQAPPPPPLPPSSSCDQVRWRCTGDTKTNKKTFSQSTNRIQIKTHTKKRKNTFSDNGR